MSYKTTDDKILLPKDLESHLQYRWQKPSIEQELQNTEITAEQTLWRKVILQAILDAALAPTSPKARRDKTRAIMWFSIHDKDFIRVCELASVDPSRAIAGVKKHIKHSTLIHRRKSHMQRFRKRRAASQETVRAKGDGLREKG